MTGGPLGDILGQPYVLHGVVASGWVYMPHPALCCAWEGRYVGIFSLHTAQHAMAECRSLSSSSPTALPGFDFTF